MEIIECKCEKCGNDKSYKKKINNLEYGECTKCGAMTYSRALTAPKQQLVRCPYCNSYEVEKISQVTKAANVAAFGIFSLGKVTKQWHCNNCKSNF
ncbi:MAG: hypothetical protein IJ751_07005 [Oscillospiraceae bacterium]|nr:hypothetical protein [Oscillospiraceae bacterium]